MKSNGTQLTVLPGLLADEINAIIQYVAYSETCDNSDHAELHKAILEMHNDFPKWLQQRIAFLDHASVVCAFKKGSKS
jgi:bacterioferritin (cytochrome b1)